jgi:hypothetical protein
MDSDWRGDLNALMNTHARPTFIVLGFGSVTLETLKEFQSYLHPGGFHRVYSAIDAWPGEALRSVFESVLRTLRLSVFHGPLDSSPPKGFEGPLDSSAPDDVHPWI